MYPVLTASSVYDLNSPSRYWASVSCVMCHVVLQDFYQENDPKYILLQVSNCVHVCPKIAISVPKQEIMWNSFKMAEILKYIPLVC